MITDRMGRLLAHDVALEAERVAFEEGFAVRSMTTVEQLHHWGRYGEPCDCGEDECTGWSMGHQHGDALMDDENRP